MNEAADYYDGAISALEGTGKIHVGLKRSNREAFSKNNPGAVAEKDGTLSINSAIHTFVNNDLTHTLKHEAFHHGADIRDQALGGILGYSKAPKTNLGKKHISVFKRLPVEAPHLAIRNPDNLIALD